MRDFWRGEHATLPEFASRLTGSSDLYQSDGRRPVASVNFVTCHDGFTLADLVSYNHKHNEANGEDGRDGTDDNRSWNCGAEGPTDDPAILALRDRQQRNFLATLLLSQGVPMLLAGDELGRTQRGNNNAYCQDNEISWVRLASRRARGGGHAGQARRSASQRATRVCWTSSGGCPAARGPSGVPPPPLLPGQASAGCPASCGDIAWFTPAGQEMTDDDWQAAPPSR